MKIRLNKPIYSICACVLLILASWYLGVGTANNPALQLYGGVFNPGGFHPNSDLKILFVIEIAVDFCTCLTIGWVVTYPHKDAKSVIPWVLPTVSLLLGYRLVLRLLSSVMSYSFDKESYIFWRGIAESSQTASIAAFTMFPFVFLLWGMTLGMMFRSRKQTAS